MNAIQEFGIEIDEFKSTTFDPDFLTTVEDTQVVTHLEMRLGETCSQLVPRITFLDKIEFLNLKKLEISQKYDPTRGNTNVNDFDIIWYLNDGIHFKYYFHGLGSDKYFILRFTFWYFYFISTTSQTYQKLKAKEVSLKIHICNASKIRFDETYFYFDSYTDCEIINYKKVTTEIGQQFPGTLPDTKMSYILAIPKEYLAHFSNLFQAKNIVDHKISVDATDVIQETIQLCYRPHIRVELFYHEPDIWDQLINSLSSQSQYDLLCTSSSLEYFERIMLFKDWRVRSLVEHLIHHSWECSEDQFPFIIDAINTTWRKYLLEFQITLCNQKLVVPLLETLKNCRFLKKLRIQFMINDYINGEAEGVQEWLNDNYRFWDQLESFIRTPIPDWE